MLDYIIPAIVALGYGAVKYRGYKLKKAEEKLQDREKKFLEKMRQSPWWNIPQNKEIVIDTSVWMNSSHIITHWFHMLFVWAPVCGWRVSVLWQTYEEIQNKKNEPQGRIASRRIDALQSSLPNNFLILRSKIESEKSASKRYADPPTLRYVLTHPDALLVTLDRDMKIRAHNAATHSNKSLTIIKDDSLSYFGLNAEDLDTLLFQFDKVNKFEDRRLRLYSDFIDTGIGNKLPPILPAIIGKIVSRDNNERKKEFLRELQLVHKLMEEMVGVDYTNAPKAQQTRLDDSELSEYADMLSYSPRWLEGGSMIDAAKFDFTFIYIVNR